MTYTNIRLFTANGIPEALSNLWYGTDCSVVEIQDAIEDAKNAADLLRRIQKMKLLRKVALDRETGPLLVSIQCHTARMYTNLGANDRVS